MQLRPPSSTRFPYTTLFRSLGRVLPGQNFVIHHPAFGVDVRDQDHALVSGIEIQGRKGLHAWRRDQLDGRSEEHTSELQSLTNIVCRLLLEKKKRSGRSHCA